MAHAAGEGGKVPAGTPSLMETGLKFRCPGRGDGWERRGGCHTRVAGGRPCYLGLIKLEVTSHSTREQLAICCALADKRSPRPVPEASLPGSRSTRRRRNPEHLSGGWGPGTQTEGGWVQEGLHGGGQGEHP